MSNTLKHFEGKVCTILTMPTNRFFDETQHTNVFVGLVEEVEEYGVWVIQLTSKKKSFFTARGLVGIIEETVIPMTQEEATNVRAQVERRLPEKNPQQTISVESLKLIKKKP